MFTLSYYVISLLPVPRDLDHLALFHWQDWDRENLHEQMTSHAVIASLSQILSSAFKKVWSDLRTENPGLQLIVIASSSVELENYYQIQASYPFFRIFEGFDDPDFEMSLFEAVEKSNSLRQALELEKLVFDQSAKLKALNDELEARVLKRQRFLEDSRRKNHVTQFRWQTLRKVLELTSEVHSLSQMQEELGVLLGEFLNLKFLKISWTGSSASLKAQFQEVSVYQVPLFQDQDLIVGHILFGRDKDWPFSADEKDFLGKISEVVALTIQRLNQVDITRTLREQWQATFNAVVHPIALIDAKYNVVQANSNFYRFTGRKCHQILFDRDKPCANCNLGSSFRMDLKSRSQWLEVNSQSLKNREDEVLFFNQYLDTTDRLKLETRLLQSAKLAELGVVGSSIAHELNNPLGGILSFVQMIKMDHPAKGPWSEDLDALEEGVKRCRDIVQNLLGFSRTRQQSERMDFDLRALVEALLKKEEPQLAAEMISLRRRIIPAPMIVFGHQASIAQAMTALLQISLMALREPRAKSNHVLEVSLAFNADQIEMQITDNGRGLDQTLNNPSLSYPLAQQIILDHGGTIETLTPVKGLRTFRLTLPRKA